MPAPTAWVDTASKQARRRLAAPRRGWSPPPFTAAPELGDTTGPAVTLRQQPAIDDGLPRGVRIAGAWAWRIILFIAAAYLLVRLVGVLRVVVIPVVVALLLAALFQPVAAALHKRGMNRSLAAGLVLITVLIVVFGGLGLIVQTFISQSGALITQVSDGID